MFKFVLAAALSLSACTTQPLVVTPAPIAAVSTPIAVGENVLIKGSDALSYAADVYASTATLVEVAVRNGAFTDDQLRMIRVLNNHSINLLNGTDKSLTLAQRAASMLTAVGQLRSILARK